MRKFSPEQDLVNSQLLIKSQASINEKLKTYLFALGCTHFNWLPKNRGTCLMKTGPIQKFQASKNNSPAIRCGALNQETVKFNSIKLTSSTVLMKALAAFNNIVVSNYLSSNFGTF